MFNVSSFCSKVYLMVKLILPVVVFAALYSPAHASYVIHPDDKNRLPWPNAVVPYILDASVTPQLKEKLRVAIDEFHTRTPIRFVERTDENAHEYPIYKRVILDKDAINSNAGHIGMDPSKAETILTISEGVASGVSEARFGLRVIVHELAHVVGLYHENNRADLWDFFTIDWEKVVDPDCPDTRAIFTGGLIVGDYDYFSALDNRPPGCGVNEQGGPSLNYIIPNDPNISADDVWSRRDLGYHLSEGNIEAIEHLYPIETVEHGGVVNLFILTALFLVLTFGRIYKVKYLGKASSGN